MLLIHAAEISVWALCYLWAGCVPDAESAFYFSGATYTTLGYGDLVLPKPWRMLGPVEGLTGILMCGLSAGLFFAVVSRIYASRLQTKAKMNRGKHSPKNFLVQQSVNEQRDLIVGSPQPGRQPADDWAGMGVSF